MKKQWIGILITGLSLGTAWAIRGQFGHEQGAAWAGALGAFTLVLVSKRKDWYSKIFTIALASAVGWGAGGMISYGMVVGYGRSDNFPNALYGLLMLFVIGGLFGLLGGGLTGLTLESTGQKRVKWGRLISEMTAGGAIAYYFLVSQLEILMTPPRSEAWAIILGAGLAMIWYMVRNNFGSSLRVAMISCLGAGFGFTFGNFLQITGNVLGISFNMWNVMEYSIGFFGGISTAYGVFTSVWPEESIPAKRWENISAFLVVLILVPGIVFKESLRYSLMLEKIGEISSPERIALFSSIISGMILVASAGTAGYILQKARASVSRSQAMLLFIVYFTAYICISYIVSGAFAGRFMLNHHLYWANFIVIFLLLRIDFPAFKETGAYALDFKKWFLGALIVLAIIFLLTLIAVNIHGELGGSHDRFDLT